MPRHAIGRQLRALSTVAKAALWAVCLLAMSIAVSGCGGGPPKPKGVFSGYPKNAALSALAQTHAEAANDREQRLLLTTWFLDGDPRVAMMCSVLPNGHVTTYQYIHQTAVQNTRSSDLPPEQLQALKFQLTRLPPTQKPPMNRLLIVSSRQGGRWVTRTYDNENRPEAVNNFFKLSGAPIVPAP